MISINLRRKTRLFHRTKRTISA